MGGGSAQPPPPFVEGVGTKCQRTGTVKVKNSQPKRWIQVMMLSMLKILCVMCDLLLYFVRERRREKTRPTIKPVNTGGGGGGEDFC